MSEHSSGRNPYQPPLADDDADQTLPRYLQQSFRRTILTGLAVGITSAVLITVCLNLQHGMRTTGLPFSIRLLLSASCCSAPVLMTAVTGCTFHRTGWLRNVLGIVAVTVGAGLVTFGWLGIPPVPPDNGLTVGLVLLGLPVFITASVTRVICWMRFVSIQRSRLIQYAVLTSIVWGLVWGFIAVLVARRPNEGTEVAASGSLLWSVAVSGQLWFLLKSPSARNR